MDDLKEALRQYILSAFLPGERASNLRDDTPLRANGILDSMGVLLVVRFLEQRIGSEIDVHELRNEHLESINTITAFVSQRTAS